MTTSYFKKILNETIAQIHYSLGVKAIEYARNDNAMHNFDVGARKTGKTREQVLYGFALKHHISIEDIRNDIEKGILPSKEMVNEKFNDAINYLILEKASVMERIDMSSKVEEPIPNTFLKCNRCSTSADCCLMGICIISKTENES